MADINNVIATKIVVDTTQVSQATRTVNELKEAVVSAKGNKSKSTMFDGEIKSLKELQAELKLAQAELKNYNAMQKLISEARERTNIVSDKRAYNDQNTAIKETSKNLREQASAHDRVSSARERVNVNAQKQLYTDQNASIKANSSALKEQMNANVRYDNYLNNLGNKYNAQDTRASAGALIPNNYAQNISVARTEAERLHQIMQQTGTVESKLNFANARKGLMSATDASTAFNRSIGVGADSVSNLGQLGLRIKSHFSWMLSGALLMGAMAVPVGAFQTLKEIELGMAGVQQVLPRLHESRVALNEEAIAIIGIAEKFGLATTDIIDSYKLWARAYKDTDVVKTLVSSAAMMAKADNFSMIEANKAIEGIMLQFGVRIKTAEEASKASMKIVDSMTNVSHNAMVSSQDLAAANIRSASAARQAGVSFDFLQGMIGTMSRNTGRAGGEIGNAIRSMLVSIHSDKAVKEIEKMGVAMYKVGVDGSKSFRDVEEVITELMLVSDATDKNVDKMMLSISGGERKLAA